MIIKKPSTDWDSDTLILDLGDIGYEIDTYKIKIGNGLSTYDVLTYATVLIETKSFFETEDLTFDSGIVLLESDTGKFKIGNGSLTWSALSYEQVVTASRFNNLQSRIQLILGNGAGVTGYGQGTNYGAPLLSAKVDTNNTVDAEDINNIYADIVRARIHQVGVAPTDISQIISNQNIIANDTSFFVDDLGNQTTDNNGTEKGLVDFENLMIAVEQDKRLANSSQMSLEPALTSVRSSSWNGSVYHEFDVIFDNADHRRHYFNSGGEIRFLSANTGAPTNSKGEKWGEFLSSFEIYTFGYEQNYSLSNVQVYQELLKEIATDLTILGNTYTIYAKATNTKTLTFKVEYVDTITIPPTPSPINSKDFVDWNGTQLHQYIHTFADNTARNNFFDNGGTIEFSVTNDYNSNDTRTLDWKLMIQSMGDVIFSANKTISNLGAGKKSSIGNNQLTEQFQRIYQMPSTIYPEMNYSIYARTVTGTENIEFRIELNNTFNFSATRTCIAVIDEVSRSNAQIRNSWLDFRRKWPTRPFYLLWPNINIDGSFRYTGSAESILKIPAEYTADPIAADPIAVKRDSGVISQQSDWFVLTGLDALPYGSNVALFIDTSGSMNKGTVAASLNLFRAKLKERKMNYIEVDNRNENWVDPFKTIPDGRSSSNISPGIVLGTSTSQIKIIDSPRIDEDVKGRLENTVLRYRATGNAVEVNSPQFISRTRLT